MGAIVNGIVLHGPTRAFGGTFLIFSDYMRPSVRIASLMNIPSIYVWTHDSVALGEDGPTHQPIEQLADAARHPELHGGAPRGRERDQRRSGSSCFAATPAPRASPSPARTSRCSRAARATASGDVFASADNAAKGAYVLAEAPGGTPDVILIGTGSEVQLAVAARETLAAEGINARVVSAPSLEWFAEQDEAYRESVLPASVTARVSVEAGLALTWRGIVGDKGRSVSIEHFGASADYKTLFQKFGITADAVVEAARETIAAAK